MVNWVTGNEGAGRKGSPPKPPMIMILPGDVEHRISEDMKPVYADMEAGNIDTAEEMAAISKEIFRRNINKWNAEVEENHMGRKQVGPHWDQNYDKMAADGIQSMKGEGILTENWSELVMRKRGETIQPPPPPPSSGGSTGGGGDEPPPSSKIHRRQEEKVVEQPVAAQSAPPPATRRISHNRWRRRR